MRKGHHRASGLIFILRLLLAANLVTACASVDSDGSRQAGDVSLTPKAEPDSGEDSLALFFGRSERVSKDSQIETTLTSGTLLVVKSTWIDPVIRPVSTIKALLGVAIKSAGGVFERAFINQLRFPKLEQQPIPLITNEVAMDLTQWERDLDEITGSRSSRGSIDYLIDGDGYFPRLLSAIDSARESVDIRTYIFDNDDVAVDFADHLRDKSDEVDIRILADGLGSLIAGHVDSASLPQDFTPPTSIERYLEYGSRVELRHQSNPWFTGDHVKITLIDQHIAFLGGMNIGREYRYDWHDLMMEINGPVVNLLQFEFDKSWQKSGWQGDLGWLIKTFDGVEEINLDHEDYYPLRLLATNLDDSQIYRAQIAAIRRAQSYIFIENAYFTDDKMLFELARARRRGVDVRLIVSSSGDSGLINLSGKATTNRLLQNGIRVYAYPGMTHVKAAVYDGWACLGSANFDKLSLQINQEINIATSHTETVQQLLELVFEKDFAISTEIQDQFRLNPGHHLAEVIADQLL